MKRFESGKPILQALLFIFGPVVRSRLVIHEGLLLTDFTESVLMDAVCTRRQEQTWRASSARASRLLLH